MLNEATLDKLKCELEEYSDSSSLILKLTNVNSKENRLERLLKAEILEELDQITITR